ncbi:MAG TPA: hypothetical protein VIL32_07560 [Steroidobacteraceae bacterium]
MFAPHRALVRKVSGEGRSATVTFLEFEDLPQEQPPAVPTLQSPAALPLSIPEPEPFATSEPNRPDTAITIDWLAQAEHAAARYGEELEREDQSYRRFGTPPAREEPTAKPKSAFAWSHAQTQRIEALPEGGTLVWLNERCALVISGAVMPVCMLGKQEARGDLFEGMRDAPELGDWKEPR